MKHFKLLLLLSSVHYLALFANAQVATMPLKRTLTDTNGRKLSVTIVSKNDDFIQVRRESDGKEFDIRISSLSTDDQQIAKELQDPKSATEPNLNKDKADGSQPEPSDSSTQPEMPNLMMVDIPGIDAQLAELTAIAEEFSKDPKRSNNTKTLRDRIAKAKDGNPDALANLSWLIREIYCTRGFPDGFRHSFDILRLALVDPTPNVLIKFFRCYDLGGAIPKEYANECYAITKSHADSGNIDAMIALGACWTNGNCIPSVKPTEAGSNAKNAVDWLEKALLAKPNEDQKSRINGLLAKAYNYNNQPEKALPLLIEGANGGDPWLMGHLASLYYNGRGCDRNLAKAVEWFEKEAAAKGKPNPSLLAAKTELEYGRGSVKGKFMETEFTLRIFGKAEAKQAVVIFGSSGFNANKCCAALADYEPIFNAGWNLVIFDYPQVGPFGKVQSSIREWMASQSSDKPFNPVDFTGFGESVLSPLAAEKGYNQFHLIGNSLGAGAMAWDLETIRKKHKVSVLWISPTEMFLPDIARIKAAGKIGTIGMPNEDPFVRSKDLISWIESTSIKPSILSNLPSGHLILGEKLPYKDLATCLAEILP